MSDFIKNALGGLFGTIYIFCFEFPIMMVSQVFVDHMPIGEFLGNQLVTFFLVWFICSIAVSLYRDLLKAANTPRNHDNRKPGGSNADHDSSEDKKNDSGPDHPKN
jgi:ABC-type multidrug transport system fused ATPase/permease subunit